MIPSVASLAQIDDTMQAGAVLHWLLECELVTVDLVDDRRVRLDNRCWPKPWSPDLHKIAKDWSYELEVYARARCERCSKRDPRRGLRLAYWGAWLCADCTQELGAPDGALDRRGWPDHPAERSAA